MRLPTIPKDTAARLLLISPALLYVGLGVGLPLLLSHLPKSESPSAALAAVGAALIFISVVVPPVLLSKAASLLKSNWPLHALLSIVFWPLGTFLVGLSLWDKRANHERKA